MPRSWLDLPKTGASLRPSAGHPKLCVKKSDRIRQDVLFPPGAIFVSSAVRFDIPVAANVEFSDHIPKTIQLRESTR